MIKITPYSTAFQRTLCWGGLSMLDTFFLNPDIWDKKVQPRVKKIKHWQEECFVKVSKEPLSLSGSRLLEKVYDHFARFVWQNNKDNNKSPSAFFALLYFVIGCKCSCPSWTNTTAWRYIDIMATTFFNDLLASYPQAHDDGYKLYCELLEIAGA